jgi:hypothetical protein
VIDPNAKPESQYAMLELDDTGWTPIIRDCLEEIVDTDEYSDEQLEHLAVLFNRVYVDGVLRGQQSVYGQLHVSVDSLVDKLKGG